MHCIARWTLVLWLLFPLASAGQSDCADGTIHDDGSFENGYGGIAAANFAHYVMRIDPPTVPTEIESFCICWSRVGVDPSVEYDIHVWDSDGPGGGPGTKIATLEDTQAVGVPGIPNQGFFRHNVTGSPTITGPIYVGPEWSTVVDGEFFLCADENGPASQPGFFDLGILAGIFPPDVPITDGFANYRNLGVRVVFADSAPPSASLSDTGGLIVPGFEVDLSDPDGAGTIFAVRNTADTSRTIDIDYYPFAIGDPPLRRDTMTLGPRETAPVNVGLDVTGLLVEDGRAKGLILVNQLGGGAEDLQGDYFRVDFTNDFATGDRMVRPSELCDAQEIRYVNFGGGTGLRILLDSPPTGGAAAFSYTAYAVDGTVVVEDDFFTTDHLVSVDQGELVPGEDFGTLVFEFGNSGGGWVSAEYKAFGRFSLELNSACLEDSAASSSLTTEFDPELEKARRIEQLESR